MANIVTNPTADQSITAYNLLPAPSNTTQSLGTSSAPWNASLKTATAASINGVLCATDFSGSDIGAQINAAYAALPANGGEIYVPASASSYNFMTSIIFNTPGKPARLFGAGNIATKLNYTPTSGTAITIDTGVSNKSPILENFLLTGPGSDTAQGIVIGDTNGNGTNGVRLTLLTIESFTSD